MKYLLLLHGERRRYTRCSLKHASQSSINLGQIYGISGASGKYCTTIIQHLLSVVTAAYGVLSYKRNLILQPGPGVVYAIRRES